jgi:hypothetical protein
MDESNATRVSAPLDQVAERSDRRPQGLEVTLRVETTHSAKFLVGFLLNTLKRAGLGVDAIAVGRPAQVLANYARPRGDR